MTKEQIELLASDKQQTYTKLIWNAAIDTAAEACDKVQECKAAARIRELKK